MRLSFSIPTSLLLFLLPLQTFSSPAPEPIPGTLATQNGPITVPVLSLGAAILAFGGATRVYYQHTDGSIHELVGNGNPSPSRVYVDQIILPTGKARLGTPIVAVDSGNLQIVRATPFGFIPSALIPSNPPSSSSLPSSSTCHPFSPSSHSRFQVRNPNPKS